MLPTIIPPEQWAQKKPPIDTLKRREMVRKSVLLGNERKIYKIEAARGFAGDNEKGAACLYVSGCSYLCQFCFVNPESLSGTKGEFYSPAEAFEKLKRIVLQTKNPQVQFNGGEIFLAPDWTIELIRLLSKFFEQKCTFASDEHPGRIWCDTMGFDLMREPQVFEALEQYRKHVVLYISTKGHPNDYEALSRAPSSFANEPFLALSKAWGHRLVAMPEVIDRFFWPQRMDWYIKRLLEIHPNAPRVLYLDQYSPVNRVRWAPDKKMKIIGFRPNKGDPERNAPFREEALEEWNRRLDLLYGPEKREVFDCDNCPDESFRMVERLILNS